MVDVARGKEKSLPQIRPFFPGRMKVGSKKWFQASCPEDSVFCFATAKNENFWCVGEASYETICEKKSRSDGGERKVEIILFFRGIVLGFSFFFVFFRFPFRKLRPIQKLKKLISIPEKPRIFSTSFFPGRQNKRRTSQVRFGKGRERERKMGSAK